MSGGGYLAQASAASSNEQNTGTPENTRQRLQGNKTQVHSSLLQGNGNQIISNTDMSQYSQHELNPKQNNFVDQASYLGNSTQ